ncbi:sulfite exporter TauE/SafE family protein [Shewanella gaetbuli]
MTLCLLLLLWGAWAWQADNLQQLLLSHSGFTLLGITGAIFANATGAGGGVIFIPAFTALSFSEGEAIHTSFLIQCFGMTAGALTWAYHYFTHHKGHSWQGFAPFSIVASITSILGLWASEFFALAAPISLHLSFSIFSITLGAIIIYNTRKSALQTQKEPFQQHGVVDCMVLCFLGFVGGIITAWLSVGVGEIIVIYLMLRGYCAKLSIATGVVVSAITVWAATPLTLGEGSMANFEVLLFAGPGAAIGGLIAKRIALFFSVVKLKLFFAAWIMLTGFVMLFVA